MDKLLEVKEFDAIISNSDYKDDSKYRYLEKKRFDNLVSLSMNFQQQKTMQMHWNS